MKKEKKHIKLGDIDRGNVHKVPEGYFNKLNTDIKNSIDKEKSSSEKKEKPVFKLGIPVAVAAMLALAYFLFWEPIGNDGVDNMDIVLAEISTDDIINYLEDIELSEDDILASVDVEDLAMDVIGEEDFLDQLDVDDDDILDAMEEFDLEDYNL